MDRINMIATLHGQEVEISIPIKDTKIKTTGNVGMSFDYKQLTKCEAIRVKSFHIVKPVGKGSK